MGRSRMPFIGSELQESAADRRRRRLTASDLHRQFIKAMVAERELMTDFTAADVIVRGDTVPSAYLLRATLSDLRVDTPRQLGKVLQRLEGAPIGGWVVRRVTRDAAGTIWRIEADSRPNSPLPR